MTCDLGKFLVDCIQTPVLYKTDTCKLVEDLVDELLSTCQDFLGVTSSLGFSKPLGRAVSMKVGVPEKTMSFNA